MSKKQKLIDELNKLEAELDGLGTAVADSQVWHKRARIDAIKKELAQLDMPKNAFNAGNDKLQEMMAQKQDVQLSPEQIAELNAGRE